MKNVIIINSTFRRGGNSELLAAKFAEGAKEAGHAVSTVNLRDLDLNFCIGCMRCQKIGKCVLDDGVNALLDVVQNADVIAFATPVYYYCMSGQLKTFLDRLNALYTKDNKFKKVYLLATAAEDDVHAMDGTVKGIEGWIECFDGVELAGVVYGINANEAGEILKTSAPAEAYLLGKNIK